MIDDQQTGRNWQGSGDGNFLEILEKTVKSSVQIVVAQV
jgi:hypothetical protein